MAAATAALAHTTIISPPLTRSQHHRSADLSVACPTTITRFYTTIVRSADCMHLQQLLPVFEQHRNALLRRHLRNARSHQPRTKNSNLLNLENDNNIAIRVSVTAMDA